mmetsp:Transcript_3965/g.8487  ORF Transcript_3965/g.8487 Transcript_3965/m.8487 type:complete len:86 (-) Transcript_3965:1427-1684(-)
MNKFWAPVKGLTHIIMESFTWQHSGQLLQLCSSTNNSDGSKLRALPSSPLILQEKLHPTRARVAEQAIQFGGKYTILPDTRFDAK